MCVRIRLCKIETISLYIFDCASCGLLVFKRGMNSKYARLFVFLLGSFIFSYSLCFSADDYESPNFLNQIKGVGELSTENEIVGDIIVKHLVGFAINLEGNPEAQAKAIALAWHCNEKARRLVIEADFYLRLGEFPEEGHAFSGAPSAEGLSTAAEKLFSYAKRLEENSEEAEKNLAAFTFDLLQSKSVASGLRDDAKSAMKTLPDPSWDGVIASGDGKKKVGDDGLTTAAAIMEGGKFARRQSLIKGLLVVNLGGSEYAGQASQMNATVVDGSSKTSPTEISFNQDVGDSMGSALKEVQKFLSVRHKGLPPGKKIEIAFEEQYSSKDGPSAAVACTLLLDSLITGDELDANFAVTGDMNADGSVQPVGGIDGKIRGATKRDCTHVAVPKVSIGLLSDMLVVNDMKPLIAIQVFSLKKYDDALALAKSPEARDPKIQEAIDAFKEVQKVLLQPNGTKFLTNSHVQAKLQKVVAAAPNHESARLLLLKSIGKIPTQLSLRGSFSQIDKITKPIWEILKTGELDGTETGLKDSIFSIRRVRRLLDDRAKPTADALEELSKALGAIGESKLGGNSARVQALLRNYRAALSRVKTEYNKLASNPDIQEELIK